MGGVSLLLCLTWIWPGTQGILPSEGSDRQTAATHLLLAPSPSPCLVQQPPLRSAQQAAPGAAPPLSPQAASPGAVLGKASFGRAHCAEAAAP